ncbi:hypothetical protein I5L03_09105 [Erythrobacter sp. JGD-13]|uniref:SH3b domain-containing protein n=2 Tax=Aurantiacibacter sediminis TaxID=2793064 RepID=A0ABS0N4A4_9SPHN|nr:hypothetical protein [Aurantiacibacter sediminis]
MRSLLCIILMAISAPAAAQDVELPYWASISAEEANMRAGASEVYPIEWIYERPGLPVKVIRLYQGWRYIEEPDGTRGWMFSGLLSTKRTAIVTGDEAVPMREAASDQSAMRWNLEPGVIGELGECSENWCLLDVEGHQGWVAMDHLWGAGEP